MKLKLDGFNNLSKTLNVNFYNIYYVNETDYKSFADYINEYYGANRLTILLKELTNKIDANILNITKQDYDPQGASVNILISEQPIPYGKIDTTCNTGAINYPNYVLGHLDKSHITVHTYPEIIPRNNLCVVRSDIEVSSCGEVSAIESLNYLLEIFESDAVSIDYRIRGFTRDISGVKHKTDHEITSIQEYISTEIKEYYNIFDDNILDKNIYFTTMKIKNIDSKQHYFNYIKYSMTEDEKMLIKQLIETEISEIL